MKRMILFAALLISSSVFAQGPFNFGPMVGFNQSTLSTDINAYKEAAAAGMHGGVFARVTISKIWIQPEFNMGVHRGELDFEYTPTGGIPGVDDVNATQEISITAADIPLIVGYQFVDAKVVKLRAGAGPVLSIPFKANVTVSKKDVPDTDLFKLKDSAKPMSIQAGVGIDVLKFTLDARYNLGLSSISDPKQALGDIKNNFMTITLGFKIL